MQRQKTAAFEAGDLEGAAALREREKQLRAEELRLEHEWAAGIDVWAVIAENQRVHRELDRLRDLLRQHGIDPGRRHRANRLRPGPVQAATLSAKSDPCRTKSASPAAADWTGASGSSPESTGNPTSHMGQSP